MPNQPVAQPSTPSMDNDVVNLAKAIRQTESGGNFNAKGGSGESGAYQWMPGTWKAHAKQALGNENAEMSPSNQNAVAYTVLKSWKDQGLNPAQIAAKWNSGSEVGWENKRGVNSAGVQYDVPKYVKSVTDAYQTVKQGGQAFADPNNPSSTAAPQPEGDGILKSMAKAVVSPVATMLARPFQAGAALIGASGESIDEWTKNNLGDWVAPTPKNMGDVKKDVGRGMQTVAMGMGPVSGGTAFGTGMSLEQGNDLLSTNTALYAGGGAVGGKLLDLVGKPLLNGAGMVIGKITPEIIKEISGRGAQAVEKFMAQHSILPDAVSGGINKAAQGLETVANAPFKVAGDAARAVGPSAEGTMNRVARLTPTQANQFKQMAGESHGAYLSRTGNFGSPEEIVQREAEKFANSLLEVDAALAKISGRFKSQHLDMILDDLLAREARIGVPGPEFQEISSYVLKNRSGGLTMEEANYIKRMYEREVKLGYTKENNTEGVARATRLDTALRNWQFKVANDNGLKNLPQLNKQTRLSKFIVDKLGRQIGGKTGNEAINLTDWIILSNGDPTAIAAFLIKKGLSSKGLQSKMAKMMSGKPVGPIKAEFGETSGLPALIPGREYKTTIEMGGPKKSNSVEPPAKKINRSSSLKPQLRLPAPKSTAQGTPTILPKSVRETNLGLDEVKNAKISQTSRKSLPQPGSQPKPLEKSYTKTVQEPQKKATAAPNPNFDLEKFFQKQQFKYKTHTNYIANKYNGFSEASGLNQIGLKDDTIGWIDQWIEAKPITPNKEIVENLKLFKSNKPQTLYSGNSEDRLSIGSKNFNSFTTDLEVAKEFGSAGRRDNPAIIKIEGIKPEDVVVEFEKLPKDLMKALGHDSSYAKNEAEVVVNKTLADLSKKYKISISKDGGETWKSRSLPKASELNKKK